MCVVVGLFLSVYCGKNGLNEIQKSGLIAVVMCVLFVELIAKNVIKLSVAHNCSSPLSSSVTFSLSPWIAFSSSVLFGVYI